MHKLKEMRIWYIMLYWKDNEGTSMNFHTHFLNVENVNCQIFVGNIYSSNLNVLLLQILHTTALSNLVFYNCGFQHLRHSRTSARHWGLNTSSLFSSTLDFSLLISLPTSKLMNVLSILNLKRAIQVNQSYYLSLMSSCCMCIYAHIPFLICLHNTVQDIRNYDI